MDPSIVEKKTQRMKSWKRRGRSKERGELLEIKQSGEIMKRHGRKERKSSEERVNRLGEFCIEGKMIEMTCRRIDNCDQTRRGGVDRVQRWFGNGQHLGKENTPIKNDIPLRTIHNEYSILQQGRVITQLSKQFPLMLSNE